MSINLVGDTDEVHSVGSPPGSGGYILRDSTATNDEGRMNEVGDEPGASLWLIAREFIAANGEVPEVEGEAWEADLASAQARRKVEVDREAWFILHPQDWCAVREAEGGTAVPAAQITYRAAVRTEANSAETAIDALGTVDACRDFVPSWPTPV
ncbi:MAG: hypothetical protein QQN63_05225 [Nitrosopumilus sp.]